MKKMYVLNFIINLLICFCFQNSTTLDLTPTNKTIKKKNKYFCNIKKNSFKYNLPPMSFNLS